MIRVNGIPMLEILIKKCRQEGFRNFYISVNYLKEQIIDYFKDGSDLDVSIKYVIEKNPLGTAGSLKLLPERGELPIIVLNSDVLTKFNISDLIQFHQANKASATMCVRDYELSIPFGVVSVEGTLLKIIHEKPTYSFKVNAGIYVLNSQVIDLIQSNTYTDMPELLSRIRDDGYNVSVCPIFEYWVDVGNPESLQQAIQDFPDHKI